MSDTRGALRWKTDQVVREIRTNSPDLAPSWMEEIAATTVVMEDEVVGRRPFRDNRPQVKAGRERAHTTTFVTDRLVQFSVNARGVDQRLFEVTLLLSRRSQL